MRRSVGLLLERQFCRLENKGTLMRKLLFLICALGLPCGAWAQSNPASWENLNTLRADEKIQVIEVNSKKVSGTFLNVSDAAISLQEKAGPRTIQRQDVVSVKLRKHQHRLRNTLLGAAIGFGAGAGIGAATYRTAQPCPPTTGFGVCLNGLGDSRGLHAAFGAVIGLAGGTVVGTVWPSRKTIYLVKPR
jgi:hypothetical protein